MLRSYRLWLATSLLLTCYPAFPFANADDFPTPLNSEKSTTSPMLPSDVVASVKLPPGFKLSVFAAEPNVQNPIAITTDERGRLWVAENYSWAGGGAGGFDGTQRDRIVVLEDTDGDGQHDKRTVFWDNARKLTSIEVGNGGVWAICLPNLLFFPDKNRDDVPDSPPIVMLDGLDEGAVGHTPANGLKWGQDGWLYARHGIQATSNIGKPGSGDSQRIKINTGVWRYHPIHGTVETVMHGMTNSWGFDFDQHGEMFVINTVIGHLWHVVPGAHVERMYGVDLNPHAYQLIQQTADHVHWDTGEDWSSVRKGVSDKTNAAGGGHAHIGLMIYQGDNWPAEYQNKLYTLNLHGLRINSNVLERQGAAYVGKRAPDMCFISDDWYRGMDLITGPDGGVYIADWSDTGECHDHDGVHRTSGRIYKLTYGMPKSIANLDLSSQSNSQLIVLQSHANAWWPRTARRILTERFATVESKSELASIRNEIDQALKATTDVVKRLRLIETCYTVGASDEPWLISHLSAPSEHERVTALRFLVDRLNQGSTLSKGLKDSLLNLSRNDPAGFVASFGESRKNAKNESPNARSVWLSHPLPLVMISFVVTAIPALLMDKLLGDFLEGSMTAIGIALLVGGVAMYGIDRFCGQHASTDQIEKVSLVQAIVIGLAQILAAAFPGTSRSMATIAGGQLMGLSRSTALEFSFFLSIPVMFAAAGFKLIQHLRKEAFPSTEQWIALAAGFVTSFIVAFVVIAWFMQWVRKHGFTPFAIYRVIVGIALIGWDRFGR